MYEGYELAFGHYAASSLVCGDMSSLVVLVAAATVAAALAMLLGIVAGVALGVPPVALLGALLAVVVAGLATTGGSAAGRPAGFDAGAEFSAAAALALGLASISWLSSVSAAGGLRYRFRRCAAGHGRPLALQLAVGLLGRLFDGAGWSAGRAFGWAALGCLVALGQSLARTGLFRSDTSHIVATQSAAQALSRVAVHKVDQHFTYFFSGGYENSILMSSPDSGWVAQKR